MAPSPFRSAPALALKGAVLRSVHTTPRTTSPGSWYAPLATMECRRSALPYTSSYSGWAASVIVPVEVAPNELSVTFCSVYDNVYWYRLDSRFSRRTSRARYFCHPTDCTCVMLPQAGSGRTPLTGVLIATPALNLFDCVLTPSTLMAISAPSCRENPALIVSAYGFTMSFETMLMFGGAVDANDAGERP